MSLFRPAIKLLGLVLFVLAIFLLLPLAFALTQGSKDITGFVSCIVVCLVLGACCWLSQKNRDIRRITPRQMFLVTAVNWLVITAVSAIPFMLGTTHLDVSDAFFEAASGITTTGSTVISGLDQLPQDLLLWRSLIQWLGGLGIIGMAVAVFPFLHVGGMRLFQTESSDWTENPSSHVRKVALSVVGSYLILSVLCALAYRWFGMSWFEAVNHAMTTISTGGYSTSDASFGHFNSLPLLWISVVFMLLGAIPFVLYYRSAKQQKILIFSDEQVKGLLRIVVVSIFIITCLRLLDKSDDSFFYILSHVTFNVVSVISTTGFASADYTLWGSAIAVIFLCITFVGGCSGSTSGGIKIFRFQLFALITREHLMKALHPVASFRRYYNNTAVSESVLVSAIAYFYIVLISLGCLSLALACTGLDLVTSFTGAATALMNVGPGLGDIIGPAGNFSSVPDTAKWLLSAGMLLGRLEFITLLVLVTPSFWKW